MIVSSQAEREAVSRIVRETISSILPNLPVTAISGSKSLKDLGADSVDRVEIIGSIMSRCGIGDPMSSFNNISNIDELVDYLCQARRA